MKQELEFKIEGKEWEEALDKAFVEANKKAKIDGFRPGKAPRSVFEKKYGKKVSGWDAVITAAYQLAQLTAEKVPLADTFNVEMQRLVVNINATNVTELVIPKTAVQKMVASGADYNIFMGTKVITLTNKILADVRGSLDLKLYETKVEEFGEGFDAMFISSRSRQSFSEQTYFNVVLDPAQVGKMAYIYC